MVLLMVSLVISEPVHVFITQQSEANNHVGKCFTNHNPSRAISHPLLAIVGINLHRKGLGLEAHIDHLGSRFHLGNFAQRQLENHIISLL